MGWKTPYLMIQKGADFGVQAISAPFSEYLSENSLSFVIFQF